MLKVELEFYKGILFIRLKGILTKENIENENLNQIIEEIGFKYIVFNIDNIKQIDGYGIRYLINYNNKLKNDNGKAIVCQDSTLFLDKFIPKIEFIKKEKEVFNLM